MVESARRSTATQVQFEQARQDFFVIERPLPTACSSNRFIELAVSTLQPRRVHVVEIRDRPLLWFRSGLSLPGFR